MSFSRRTLVLASVPTLATLATTRYWSPTLALDHDAAAAAISQLGVDPMLGINPATGTIFLTWIEPAAMADHAAATPGAEDHAEATPAAEDQMAMPPSGQAMVARSTDGGQTFGEPVAASGDDPDVMSYVGSSPLVFAGPDGDIYLAYGRNMAHEGVSFGRDTLRLARSTDDGATFAPAVDVFTDTDALEAGSFQDVIAAPDGALYAAWLSYRQYMPENGAGDDSLTEVRITRSDDAGLTFGPSILVDDRSCECCRTSLTASADGTLYLAWRDQVPQDDGGDPVRNMVVSSSHDSGATWSTPALIHDDAWRVAQCPESGPVIAIDRDGLLHAAWFTGKEDGPGVYYAASRDDGTTFSDPQALATADYFPHANVRGFLADDGVFWVTWDDPRTEAGAISLVSIDAEGTVTPVDTAKLTGRTPDIVPAPTGPLLTWLTDEGIQVAIVGHDEGAA